LKAVAGAQNTGGTVQDPVDGLRTRPVGQLALVVHCVPSKRVPGAQYTRGMVQGEEEEEALA